MEIEMEDLQEVQLNMDTVIDFVNITLIIVGMLIIILLLIVSVQFKTRRVQMGYFLYAACTVLMGLSLQIADRNMSEEIGDVHYICSRVMYSLVAPLFALYFMETEREEGEEWDKRFWTNLQFLIAILASALAAFGKNSILVQLTTMVQYAMVMVMLMFSAKSIRASIGFVLGSLFPVTSSVIAVVNPRIDFLGFSLVMLLLSVFFLYQIDTEREVLKSQAELSEKRVALLMEQIHPHFIYNSLQQIAILSEEDAKAVKPAIQDFSGYLRRKFQALTGEPMISFVEEMEHVDMYIQLAQILPSRHFEVEKDIQVKEFMLPPLTLQPLVENAIQYGIGMSEEGEKIRIRTFREKGYIVITVQDDGHGKAVQLQTQKRYKSVGTENVRTRLRILCQGELSIEKTDAGTTASIRIPETEVQREMI